jgi:hypothetical protein
MSPTDRDDDPTHALDDFVRRMRQPASPPHPTPDLSGIHTSVHPPVSPAAPAAPARPRGGVLRSGQRWDADDVEDVPVLDLPRPPPADTGSPQVTLPPVDLQAEQMLAALQPELDLPEVRATTLPDGDSLAAATRGARDFAASQWDTDALAAAQPVWQPDPAALQLRPASHPRLLAQWQPQAWVGALRQVVDSTTEFVTGASGPAVETYAPHRLLLLWPPQGDAGPPGRWPQLAQLLDVPAAQAGAAALALLPDDAPLWLLPDAGDVDWALGAELVLHHAPALRPFQIDGLRTFIATEREAVYARLNAGYHQPVPGGAVARR